jgi:hypothetical protein
MRRVGGEREVSPAAVLRPQDKISDDLTANHKRQMTATDSDSVPAPAIPPFYGWWNVFTTEFIQGLLLRTVKSSKYSL